MLKQLTHENFDKETNILTFENRYPSVKRITLSTNFRSSHAIVEIANAAVSGQRIGRRNILGLHRRLPKTMKAQHYNVATNQFEETMAEHGDVWNCTFSSENQEANFIADRIQELLGIPWNSAGTLRGLSYADMSILCRSLNYTKAITDELDRRNIPYIIMAAILGLLFTYGVLITALDIDLRTLSQMENTLIFATLGAILSTILAYFALRHYEKSVKYTRRDK